MPHLLENSTNLTLIKLEPTVFSDPNHSDFYYLYNHPANNTWMYYSTRSRKDFRSICETFFARMDAVYLLQERTNGIKKVIGTCSIKKFPAPRQHVIGFSSLALDPDLHGKGYGKKFFTLLYERLKTDFPEVFRYELSYGLNNPVAYTYRFYEKNGFKDEAICHDFFRSEKPVYDEEDNPYKAWLAAKGGDLRQLKNCWYADEVIAGYLTLPSENIKKYQPSQKSWQENSITSNILIAKNNGFVARKATESDLDECIKLYFLSDNEWGFLDKIALSETLLDSIKQKHLWIVQAPHKILAACQLILATPALEHTALLEHTVVEDKDAAASLFLFQSLLTFIKIHSAAIKRIEINVLDNDSHLIAGLIAKNFQYTGTLACRAQSHSLKFLDEHIFEKLLFKLEDALILCQNRLQAELFFKNNPQIIYPFNMPLALEYLQNILQILEEFQPIKTINKLSLADEHKLYSIIKIICTQDIIPTNKRLEAMQQLEILRKSIIYKD